MVSEEMNTCLPHRPLKKEVRPFFLAPGKAPGPNGFTSNFFQKFWLELKPTIMACVREFFQGRPILQASNHTWITLVPKKPTASELADFRPISCVNLIYKLLSKILASRMNEVQICWSLQMKLFGLNEIESCARILSYLQKLFSRKSLRIAIYLLELISLRKTGSQIERTIMQVWEGDKSPEA